MRAFVIAGVAGFMIWNPVQHRVRDPADRSRLSYDWQMFHSMGRGLCRVRYTLYQGGAIVPLDRFRVLGYADPDAAPEWLRRIHLARSRESRRGLVDVTESLCRRLGADASALHLWAECGTTDGWEPVFGGRAPICERLAQQRRRS